MSPYKPRYNCTYPMCPNLAEEGGRCATHRRVSRKQYDESRGTLAERGYDSTWVRLRRMKLNEQPLCEECYSQGITEQAVEVHHIMSIAEYPLLRLDMDNLMSLCKMCHERITGKNKIKL